MNNLVSAVDGGKRYELRCPKAMPGASTFLWNQKMLLQINCRGFATAQHMQPEPSKYSHAPILEHKTFMQPEPPMYAHHPGRFVYVQDAETGDLFSAPYEPTRVLPDDFVFSIGRTDAHWRVQKNGIAVYLSVTLPLDDVAELWTVRVENLDTKVRKIELYPCFSIGYMSWMNQAASYSEALGGIVARSITPYQKIEDYQHVSTLKDTTVLLHQDKPVAWEACSTAFEGEGGIHRPSSIVNGGLKNGDAIYETPIAALQYNVELAAGEQCEHRFVFAPVRNDEQANELRSKFLVSGGFESAQNEMASFLNNNRGCVYIKTPDADLDHFVNHWLDRQVFYHGDANRLTTDPQTRNYLQDAMGMAYIEPGHSRAAIIRTLSQQNDDGSLPEGVVLKEGGELKYINRIPHTDHCVWLPITLQSYLDETNDYALLEELVESHGELLSVRERTNRAMQWLIGNRDDRGLSLVAQGDWCDPMNMVGHLGKGVSSWLTIASVHAFKIWAQISSEIVDSAQACKMRAAAHAFTDAIQKYFWDGSWFSRGISDNGTVFGISSDEEGKVWLNPQSWALLSGVATPEQQAKIRAAIREHLDSPFGPMMLAPAYTSMQEHIGRVTQKHPGSGENGSVYNHAATFWIYALYVLAENEQAFEALRRILPDASGERGLARGQLPVFIPNYYRGAVKQFPRTAGRSSQLINTGASSWIYRIVVEQLLGLRGTREGLHIAPQLPQSWDQIRITRRFRGATFDIQVQRGDGYAKTMVTSNGAVLEDGIVKNVECHAHYDILVVLPAATS